MHRIRARDVQGRCLDREALEQAMEAGWSAYHALAEVLEALRAVLSPRGGVVLVRRGPSTMSEVRRLARAATGPLTRYREALAGTDVVAAIPGRIERMLPSRPISLLLYCVSIATAIAAMAFLYFGGVDFTRSGLERFQGHVERVTRKVRVAQDQLRILLTEVNDELARLVKEPEAGN